MLHAIEQRRAFRALDTKPIDNETLLHLIEAAATAPSGMNNQPWRFVTTTETERLNALKETLSPGNYWAKRAPAIIAVVTNNEWSMKLGDRVYAPFEVGMATMALQIQAVSEGLIIHPIAGFNEGAAKEVLGISEEDSLMVLLILGYPGSEEGLSDKHRQGEHSARERFPLDRIHAFDGWTGEMNPKATT